MWALGSFDRLVHRVGGAFGWDALLSLGVPLVSGPRGPRRRSILREAQRGVKLRFYGLPALAAAITVLG